MMNASNQFEREWENFLNPQLLRTNLLAASLYITAFETLKGRIIDRLREFFLEWDSNGILKPRDEYRTEVLNRNKSTLYASLSWHLDMGVITFEDLELFERIKSYRNQLTHELPNFLAQGVTSEYESNFRGMVTLLNKIETWWIVFFDIPINSDFDGLEIDKDSIMPGPVLMLNLMLKMAFGSDEEAWELYNSIRNTTHTSSGLS
jgi:hypothetical protein